MTTDQHEGRGGTAHDTPRDAGRTERGDVVQLELDGWTHGGEAVGRLPDGIACFVPHALPGEVVTVRITERRKRWTRGELVEVLHPSPHRVIPPCPHYGPGRCGGCQLQHASPAHQLELKERVLREQLQRIGGIDDPPVTGVSPVPDGWPAGYRAWARMATTADGQLGFRTAGSHQVHPVDHCLVLDDRAAALATTTADSDLEGVGEVTLLAGHRGGHVVRHPGGAVGGVDTPPAVLRVGDVDLEVSPGAFFQAGAPAAAALAAAVLAAADVRAGDTVLDLYSGVGLFSAFLAGRGADVIAVESSSVAVADARRNLEGLGVDVHEGDVLQVLAALRQPGQALEGSGRVAVAVLDPPRTGAGEAVCLALLDLAPARIVYVACDPAALARDVRTLTTGGYHLREVAGIDVFGHTAHVEAVAVLDRDDERAPTG